MTEPQSEPSEQQLAEAVDQLVIQRDAYKSVAEIALEALGLIRDGPARREAAIARDAIHRMATITHEAAKKLDDS